MNKSVWTKGGKLVGSLDTKLEKRALDVFAEIGWDSLEIKEPIQDHPDAYPQANQYAQALLVGIVAGIRSTLRERKCPANEI